MRRHRDRARQLRRRMTEAERLLWLHLRNRQIDGVKFRRQVAWGPYIVDFASFECRVIIEVDGGHHADAVHRPEDEIRDRALRKSGFRVLRFWNNDVLANTEGVLLSIREAIAGRKSPPSCLDVSARE